VFEKREVYSAVPIFWQAVIKDDGNKLSANRTCKAAAELSEHLQSIPTQHDYLSLILEVCKIRQTRDCESHHNNSGFQT
jgi:hypothetical protein